MKWIRRARQSWPSACFGWGVKWSSVYICVSVFVNVYWSQRGKERGPGVPGVTAQITHGCVFHILYCFWTSSHTFDCLSVGVPHVAVFYFGRSSVQVWENKVKHLKQAVDLFTGHSDLMINTLSCKGLHCTQVTWIRFSFVFGYSLCTLHAK